MCELFVYYRVRVGHETAALNTVNAFQTRLRQRFPQLAARLLCRSEASGGPQTWMEVYAMDARQYDGGITTEVQQDIEAAALELAPCIEGERHIEMFVPVSNVPDAQ